MASYFVRIRQGSPTGPKRGEFGPFPTQKDALKQAQVVADDFVTKGHIVTVEEGTWRQKPKRAPKRNTHKRRNPALSYEQIKKNLRRANNLALAGKVADADKIFASMTGKGMSRADMSAYISPEAMTKLRALARKRRKKRNPAKKGTGCRDAAGNFIPIPRCGGGPSPTPTKTIKIKSGDKQLTYTLDSGARTPASAKKKAISLRKLGYKARVKVFPMGIGVYRRGRKKAKARRKATTKTSAEAVKQRARRYLNRRYDHLEQRGQVGKIAKKTYVSRNLPATIRNIKDGKVPKSDGSGYRGSV